MPPASFFLQQLKNMCHEFEHETLAYYLCSHLTEGQKYVVPILDYHEDEEKNGHVFMVELMPQKVYYHADSPVAITSTSNTDRDMQVLIPKQHVPSLTDLGEAPVELLGELLEVVRSVAREVEAEHGAARVLTNLGEYQDSKHLHFHVNSGAARDES